MRKSDIGKKIQGVYFTLGKNIAKARAGMKPGELARKAEVSRQTVAAIESGKPISLESFIKIASALGVHPSDLFISENDRVDMSWKHKMLVDKLLKTFTLDSIEF